MVDPVSIARTVPSGIVLLLTRNRHKAPNVDHFHRLVSRRRFFADVPPPIQTACRKPTSAGKEMVIERSLMKSPSARPTQATQAPAALTTTSSPAVRRGRTLLSTPTLLFISYRISSWMASRPADRAPSQVGAPAISESLPLSHPLLRSKKMPRQRHVPAPGPDLPQAGQVPPISRADYGCLSR